MSANDQAGDRSTGKQKGTPRPGNGGARAGSGRKAFQPTKRQRDAVWAGIGMGMSVQELTLGVINPLTNRPISENTFAQCFREEHRHAKQSLKMDIARRLVADMREGRTCGTTIFLSKALLGLRERHEHDHNVHVTMAELVTGSMKRDG